MDVQSFGTALTVVGGPAGAAIAWLWFQREKKHVTTITEYQRIVADLKGQYLELKQDYASLWQQFQNSEVKCDSALAKLRDEIDRQRQQYDVEYRRLADRLTRIQVTNQALRSEMLAARAAEAAIRSGLHPFFAAPESWAFATLSADVRGKILSVNPSCEQLFGWAADEMIGYSVEMLIPDRFRADHRAAMAAVARSGSGSRTPRVLSVFALTKAGEEIPVDVYAVVWSVGGEPRCWAAVRRRWRSAESAGFLSDSEIPATPPLPIPVTVVNPLPIPVVESPPAPSPPKEGPTP